MLNDEIIKALHKVMASYNLSEDTQGSIKRLLNDLASGAIKDSELNTRIANALKRLPKKDEI